MLRIAFLCVAVLPWNHPQPEPKAAATPVPSAFPYAMRLPRPVDTAQRAASGFAPPRGPELVLTDIDSIPNRMLEGGDDQTKWRAIRLHNEDVKRDRIDLISELEETGYTGPRLTELLRRKLSDIRDVWNRAQFPVNSYER